MLITDLRFGYIEGLCLHQFKTKTKTYIEVYSEIQN